MIEYIKRDDAIHDLLSPSITTDAVTATKIASALSHIPVADVRENIHAEWADMDVDDYYDTIILRCGNCGNSTEFFCYAKASKLMKIMRFCPRCGAVMDKKQGLIE